MQQSLSSQLLVFVYSLALGLILGVAYDFFRIVRMVINSKNIAVFLQDVLYFIVSGLITFFFVLGVNSGNSRFYILAGEAVGWILYHITLGEVVYRCSGKLVKWAKLKVKSLKDWFDGKFSRKQENN